MSERNDTTAGIELIRQGITGCRATGDELSIPQWLTVLATTYWKGGHTEHGLATVTEGMEIAAKSKNVLCEAELYRLKGELTLQQWKVESHKSKVPNPQPLTSSAQAEAEAEACFHKAIDIARKQQAKSLELRATTSLARLWQSQGKQHAAHSMLSDIYNWFTEGFDTKDLQEAKALIEELSD